MNDKVDDNQISEDDWAAAMNEQTAAEAAPKAEDDWAAAMNEQTAAEAAPKANGAASATAATAKVFEQLGGGPQSGGGGQGFDMIMDIPVHLTVELGRTKISIRNLLQLAHGSVVELDGLAGEPMDVLVNGTLIAQGEVVVVNEKFGIRLTDIITPQERLHKLNR
jgi:flagellar motor switch protein FliN/FliY